MSQKCTVALVIVSALLVVSLAALGKLYADKRAAQAGETQRAPFAQRAWPGGGASEAVRGGQQPPADGGQGQGYAPGGGSTSPTPPGAGGAPFARGGMSRFGGGGGQRPGAPGAQPGAPPPGPGDAGGVQGPPETGSRPQPMSGPWGPGQAGSGSRPSRAPTPFPGGATAASGSGPGPMPAPDPRLTEWLRTVPRVREALENAKVAVRENNQDQLLEILDEALALLPSTSGGAAALSGPGGRRPFGPGFGPGAGGPPAGGPPAGSGDLLAQGQQMQDLLFQAFDTLRNLPEDQYREKRSQLSLGLLTEMLLAGRSGWPGVTGEAGGMAPTGPPRGVPGAPPWATPAGGQE